MSGSSWGVQCSVLQEPLNLCVPGVCSHYSSASCTGTLLSLLMSSGALISSQLTQWTSSPSSYYLWVMGFASSPLRLFVSSSCTRVWWDEIFHCCLVCQWTLQPWQRRWHLHWEMAGEDAPSDRRCSQLEKFFLLGLFQTGNLYSSCTELDY